MPEPDQRHAIDKENFMPTCNIAPRINFKMRPCALAQYSWLCLCHFMDLGLSAFKSPAHKTILRQMATVAFRLWATRSASGCSRSMCCQVSHSHTNMCKQAFAMVIADASAARLCTIDRRHATHPGGALRVQEISQCCAHDLPMLQRCRGAPALRDAMQCCRPEWASAIQ